jgi:hypothetical protein
VTSELFLQDNSVDGIIRIICIKHNRMLNQRHDKCLHSYVYEV